MKSQSTIIARVMPGVSPLLLAGWKEVRYVCRRNSETFALILTFTLIFGAAGFVSWAINNSNDNRMRQQAKQYHYAVGSTQLCNMAAERDVKDKGWIKCKVISVSKNNYYYTASFYSNDKHHTVNYKFEIPYIGEIR